MGLMNWLKGFKEKPKKVFIVHGEAEAKIAFAKEVKGTLNIDCIIPEYNMVYDIKKQAEVKEAVLEDSDVAIIRQKAKENQITELLSEIEKLRNTFEKALNNTEGYLKKDNVNIEKYKKINNNILSLENEIVNLSILSGK
ncbi:MAG: MBL fold metallo-hydrolase RNA specificity domain-containing protein [Sedimentibacter sp.]|nr:MBL fold metallo-hydrolase RNA specificity domain-containing protein [Sedimentibacter sp.]MDW5298942.1 MBL fold metallo-hydrolase RNA specificity domain-containing protein [Sedimentibacter sp.]